MGHVAPILTALAGVLTALAGFIPVWRQLREVRRRMDPSGDGKSIAETLWRVEGQVHALRDEHAGTLRHLDGRQVGVEAGQTVAMLDDHGVAVTAATSGQQYLAVVGTRSDDRVVKGIPVNAHQEAVRAEAG